MNQITTKDVYQDGMCHVDFFWRAGERVLSEVLAALRSTTQLGEATREMARMKQGFTWRSQDRGSLRLNQMETSHIWFSLRYLYRRTQQRSARLFERRANAPALRTNGQNSQTFLIFLDEILVRENLQQHWIEELITLVESATDTRFVRNLGSLIEAKAPASSERRTYRAQPACLENVMRVETIRENMNFMELAITQDEISPARWRHEFLNELWSQCPPRPTEQRAGRATRLRGREITTVIIDDPIADMESIRTGRFSSQLPQPQSIPRESVDFGEFERRVLGQFEPPQHHNARSVIVPVEMDLIRFSFNPGVVEFSIQNVDLSDVEIFCPELGMVLFRDADYMIFGQTIQLVNLAFQSMELIVRQRPRVVDSLNGEIQELSRRTGLNHSDMIDALSYAMTASPQAKAAFKKDLQEQLELENKADKEVSELTQVGRRRIIVDEEEK